MLLAGEGEEEDEENRLFFGPKLPPIRCADNAVDADEMLYWRESPFSFSFFYCLMSFAVCVTSQLSAYLDCFFEIFFLPSPSRLLKTHYLMHADLFSLALEWLFFCLAAHGKVSITCAVGKMTSDVITWRTVSGDSWLVSLALCNKKILGS